MQVIKDIMNYFKEKIVGERIYLRFWMKNDAERIAELCNEESTAKYTRIPFPYTLKDAEQYLKEASKGLESKGKLAYGIFLSKNEKNNGMNETLIGSIELGSIDWENKNAFIGYYLGKEHRKKGYMIEACKLLLDYAFNGLGLERVYSEPAEENTDSIKLIEKLNGKFLCFQPEQELLPGKIMNCCLYSIEKEDWKQAENKN